MQKTFDYFTGINCSVYKDEVICKKNILAE